MRRRRIAKGRPSRSLLAGPDGVREWTVEERPIGKSEREGDGAAEILGVGGDDADGHVVVRRGHHGDGNGDGLSAPLRDVARRVRNPFPLDKPDLRTGNRLDFGDVLEGIRIETVEGLLYGAV